MNIRGDIGIMSLPDIMRWAEANGKTGTLTISQNGIVKMFYIQEGKIIFVSSQKEGERLGEFFSGIGRIERKTMEYALIESQRLRVPFTGYLISEKIIDRKTLEQVIALLAETAFTDALKWERGTFEFNDAIPPLILNGPIKLNISSVVFQSMRIHDETRKKHLSDTGDLLLRITRKLSEGNIEIPPIPDIMRKLNETLRRDDSSIQDMVKIIMSDQVLTSKILKVANSAFYGISAQVTSLQQAIIHTGLKTIQGIVTIHTLGGFSTVYADTVREILRHSLLCAFIAKKIASLARGDPEEAFVCGLLHDIGKMAIINLIADVKLPEEDREKLIREYHEVAGFMLASKWNFSEVVKSSVKFHHNPDKAEAHKKAVGIIHLANIIANNQDMKDTLSGYRGSINAGIISQIYGERESMKDMVCSIV